MYCIYTNADVPDDLGNFDHVYPLSLGGNNTFCVWCDKSKNSIMGSEVDGALSKDPLLGFALRDSGFRGHNKTEHVPKWRTVEMDDRPHQVSFAKEKIVVWDARERRELKDEEFAGKPMSAQLKLGKHTAVRFLTKAALGGGHFLYGDLFRNTVDCEPLREVTFLDLEVSKKSNTLQNSGIMVADRFHPDSRGAGPTAIYRALCEKKGRSIFIAIPTARNSITFAVGIAGEFIGAIDVPAKTDDYPIDGEHELGHVLSLGSVCSPVAIEARALNIPYDCRSIYRVRCGGRP